MGGHQAQEGPRRRQARKVWSRLSKAIIVAAKIGGGDPDMNLRLRMAIDDAKAVGMPKENIQRAIKRGTGEIEGEAPEEIPLRGLRAGGVAVLCDVLTDNRNRTTSEIRKVFDISGGKLGASGCVAWMFEKKGMFLIPADKVEEDRLMEIALEAGADDVRRSGDVRGPSVPRRSSTSSPPPWPRPASRPRLRDQPHPQEHGRRLRSRRRPQGPQAHEPPRRP